MNNRDFLRLALFERLHSHSPQDEGTQANLTQMKAHQAAKIREIGAALESAGYLTLDEQAKALGVPRSTMWTLLKGRHKTSGLSGALIWRILSKPHLPSLVRLTIEQYVEEKITGRYGHNQQQMRRFAISLIGGQSLGNRVRLGRHSTERAIGGEE